MWEILQGCGKVMEIIKADQLTQVCNCLLTIEPMREKKKVNRIAEVYSTDIRGRLILMSFWD